jgi:hypothetical protein
VVQEEKKNEKGCARGEKKIQMNKENKRNDYEETKTKRKNKRKQKCGIARRIRKVLVQDKMKHIKMKKRICENKKNTKEQGKQKK